MSELTDNERNALAYLATPSTPFPGPPHQLLAAFDRLLSRGLVERVTFMEPKTATRITDAGRKALADAPEREERP